MKKSILKLIILASLLVGVCLSACKKEDDNLNDPTFENLTRNDIESNANRLSDEQIMATNSDGYILNIGDIIIYKTNGDHFGKLKILAFDNADNEKLTISAISYNDDGTVFSETGCLNIRGTYTCDLDAMLEAGTDEDFHWKRSNGTDTFLKPKGNATFAVY